MSEWISVKDGLPDGDCLVFVDDDPERLKIHTARYHENITIIGGHFEFDMPKVTHWMPLPPPPKENNDV